MSDGLDFSALTGEPAEPAKLQTADLVNDPVRAMTLAPQIVEALSGIYDPEIPVNIYDLGLIYDVLVDANDVVGIRMTLTSPGCPAAQSLPGEVHDKVARVPGVKEARVDVVWEPPWDKDRMSEAAKLQLGIF